MNTITINQLIDKLSKPKQSRTKHDIKTISTYLTTKYDYFINLRKNGEHSKLERLISVLNLETFQPNETIINYGEIGDKFYILLQGKVALSKATYVLKTMSISEYISYMRDILDIEHNYLRYERLLLKNQHLHLDMELLMSIPLESLPNTSILRCFVEEEEHLGEFSEGFAFGELALLKGTKRNATVKAKEKSELVSINKKDYIKIIKDLEQTRLETDIHDFKQHYPLFRRWTFNQLIRMFNCFVNETVYHNSYLYKQNEHSEYIYFVTKGKFEVYSLVSFAWVDEFFAYIVNSTTNFMVTLINNEETPYKENKLIELYNKARRNVATSPCCQCSNATKLNNVVFSRSNNDTFLKISSEHEALNEPHCLFKVNVRVVNGKDIIGIEDALEMKQRFCYVKCVSPSAEVKKIKLVDFIRVLNYNNDMSCKKMLLNLINERKSGLYRQLKKGVKYTYNGNEKVFNQKVTAFINKINQEKQSTNKVPTLPEHTHTKTKHFVLKTNNCKYNLKCVYSNKECAIKNNNTNLLSPSRKSIYTQCGTPSSAYTCNYTYTYHRPQSQTNMFNKDNVQHSRIITSVTNDNNCHLQLSSSSYINFRSHRPLASNTKRSSGLINNRSRNYNNQQLCVSSQTSFLNKTSSYSYINNKLLINSYDDLEKQVFKETGKKKITKPKDVFFYIYDDNDMNVMRIESAASTKHKRNLSSSCNNNISKSFCKYNNNTHLHKGKESYISDRIKTQIKMKDFRFIWKKRMKDNPYHLGLG